MTPEVLHWTDSAIEEEAVPVPGAPSVEAPKELKRNSGRMDVWEMIASARVFADELASRPNLGSSEAPVAELVRLREMGLLMAPFTEIHGGRGLGVTPGTHWALLRLLAVIGGGDLALGRLFEGHVNAVLLLERFGTEAQQARLAEDCKQGRIFGTWNTGTPELLRLEPAGEGYRYVGVKTFATGAGFVDRPLVTAELPGGGWQMTIPRMETMRKEITLDKAFWHPLGMQSSESYGVDFSGGYLKSDDLIGAPGDFYRDPMFRGGAIRFVAVQAGSVLRLHALFAEWLLATGRKDDPYQLARLGEAATLAQQTALWVEQSAAMAELCFYREDAPHAARMIECANLGRCAMDNIATRMMQIVTAGVGARGLLQPHRFERIVRDLTMYLRQPSPDQALAEAGRASLRKLEERAGRGAGDGFWSDERMLPTLRPDYFRHVYERDEDPWQFETSSYEAGKYADTLAALPNRHYERVLEVGCSIGVMTEKLAAHSGMLLALDVSEHALARARRRCEDIDNVQFARMEVPRELPEGEFDLIVLAEVAYYWHHRDLVTAADRLAELQAAGGHLVLVHWTPPVPDYPMTGDAVHEYWLGRPEWRLVNQLRRERFRLEVLERIVDAGAAVLANEPGFN